MSETKGAKAFYIYFDTYEHIELLTMQQRGELFTALYEYAVNQKDTEFEDGMVQMAFSFMRAQIKRDMEKYQEKCERMKKTAKVRYEKSANACICSQEEKEKNKEEEKENKKEKEEKKDKEKNKKEEKEKEEDKSSLSYSLSDSLESLDSLCDTLCSASQNEADHYAVMRSFNRICGNMVTVSTMTDSRKKAVDKAAEILGNTGFDELFERVSRSDFLSGRNGKWYGCNFDWILKPENLKKILSGAYDNPAPAKSYVQPKPEVKQTSYDIGKLNEIEDLSFMDEPGWEERAFGDN